MTTRVQKLAEQPTKRTTLQGMSHLRALSDRRSRYPTGIARTNQAVVIGEYPRTLQTWNYSMKTRLSRSSGHDCDRRCDQKVANPCGMSKITIFEFVKVHPSKYWCFDAENRLELDIQSSNIAETIQAWSVPWICMYDKQNASFLKQCKVHYVYFITSRSSLICCTL